MSSLYFMWGHSFQRFSESEPESNESSPDICEEDEEVQNGEECVLHWNEEDLQGLMQDLNEPIPEPPHPQPLLNQINALTRWLCCFILYWQVVSHVSDIAVEWLLAFLGRFLQTLNYGLGSEFLGNLILFFPTTIYTLHRISNLKRDEFEKFVICLSVQNFIIWMNVLKESMEPFFPKSVQTFFFLKDELNTVGANLSYPQE